MPTSLEELARAPRRELERMLRGGQPPDLDALVGFEFRGYIPGTAPAVVRFQKFIKGFWRSGWGVEGYNIRVRQNGLGQPWIEKRPGEAPPARFGFFRVFAAAPDGGDRRYPAAATLDYAASEHNRKWRPERLVRDCLLVPDPAQPDLLLGKAWIGAGLLHIPAGYFMLERMRPAAPGPAQ